LPTKGVKNAGFPPIRKRIGFFDTSYRGIWTLSQSQHFSHPQPLATMVDENEDLAHRQPVSGRRWLENIEMSG